MFTGAINAFTGQADKNIPQAARAFKAKGMRWVVVGDENYGEGSSREHAAMSPRFLGCAVVIVRSFARIHESNLKKQGILPLTFADPADYDKVRQGDTVSVLELASLAPGRDVSAVFHHVDDSSDGVVLRHTLNAEQIAWFKAGSALNVIKAQAK
jgi:aconitate hydratase